MCSKNRYLVFSLCLSDISFQVACRGIYFQCFVENKGELAVKTNTYITTSLDSNGGLLINEKKFKGLYLGYFVTSITENSHAYALGVPIFGSIFQILGGGGFSHYLVYSDCICAKNSEIKRFLGVANSK